MRYCLYAGTCTHLTSTVVHDRCATVVRPLVQIPGDDGKSGSNNSSSSSSLSSSSHNYSYKVYGKEVEAGIVHVGGNKAKGADRSVLFFTVLFHTTSIVVFIQLGATSCAAITSCILCTVRCV
jgi:hypothetical protein